MELTDLEICKIMAEIEGGIDIFVDEEMFGTLTVVFKHDCTYDYNPLSDDALCLKLIYKYGVEIDQSHPQMISFSCDGHSACCGRMKKGEYNKAAMLSIIASRT